MAGEGEFNDFTREDIHRLVSRISDVLYDRLQERRRTASEPRKFGLRMSNYGTKDRKLWYMAHTPSEHTAKLDPVKYLNFLIGDIWECVILSLAELSGHTVALQQAEVSLDGLVGHIDAVIDGVVVDVKSTSRFSFEHKFLNGGLFNGGDSFSYIPQILGYGAATGIKEKAFLAASKETGELALVKVPNYVKLDVRERISRANEVITMSEPPKEKCYTPEMDKAGNFPLPKDCSFCEFKNRCWADANNGEGLRVFDYASGPKYYVQVNKAPKVPETTRHAEGYIYKKETKGADPLGDRSTRE